MVLHYVTKSSSRFVKRAAAFDSDVLCRGDLDMVDVVAVPHILEDAVRETEYQDVLHRLFAEVVIDAEDLVFVEHLVDFIVQRLGGLQIVAEGLLDDDADPVLAVTAVSGSCHAMIAKIFNDVREILRGGCKVEETIPHGAVLLIELGKRLLQGVIAGRVIEGHLVVMYALHELIELGVVWVDIAAADDALFHVLGKGLLQWSPGNADNCKVLGEQAGLFQVKERWQKFALGQVARGPEDHNNAWIRYALRLHSGRRGRGGGDFCGRHIDTLSCFVSNFPLTDSY